MQLKKLFGFPFFFFFFFFLKSTWWSYSRNASCALNLISTFYSFLLFFIYIWVCFITSWYIRIFHLSCKYFNVIETDWFAHEWLLTVCMELFLLYTCGGKAKLQSYRPWAKCSFVKIVHLNERTRRKVFSILLVGSSGKKMSSATAHRYHLRLQWTLSTPFLQPKPHFVSIYFYSNENSNK